jgi:signal peptide peptidase SppA
MATKNKIKLFPSLWAIAEPELAKIESLYSGFTSDMIIGLERDSKLVTANLQAFDIADISQAGLSPDVTIMDNVGILRIEGVITHKSSFFTMLFGGATLDSLTADFKSLMNNEQVDTIVLDIGSPGGTVPGVQEFANLIFDSREQKKIIAISSSSMMSAAMWIGAAAEHVFITGGTVVTGSIGVLKTHVDTSLREAKEGIAVTEIAAGRDKRIASTHAPLTDVGRSVLQAQVEKVMDVFVGDVAKFRGVSEQEARSNMADGKTFIGDDAVKAGLVDDIKTFDLLIETINHGGLNMGAFTKKDANLENLRVEHADIYNEAVAVGADQNKVVHAEAVKTAEAASYKTGEDAGVVKERARISGINECTIVGQEKLAEAFIADGKTTPGEAAIKMINANKTANVDGLEVIKKTSAQAVADEKEETIVAKGDMTAKQKWDADPKLADEFSSFEAFEAVEKNSDNYRIKKSG